MQDTTTQNQPPSEGRGLQQEWIGFGSRLREQREARSLSLADVVKVTKINERSLANLEDGQFDALPAEVFVRGFLRSYCRCVGLDASVTDRTVRTYDDLVRRGGAGQPKPLSLLKVASRKSGPDSANHPEQNGVKLLGDDGAVQKRAADGAAPAAPEEKTIMQALHEAGRGTSRVSLTLAVVILVIVATLTLSLLLRRPSHVGDGISLGGRTDVVSIDQIA
jgi:hypothetical protein